MDEGLGHMGGSKHAALPSWQSALARRPRRRSEAAGVAPSPPSHPQVKHEDSFVEPAVSEHQVRLSLSLSKQRRADASSPTGLPPDILAGVFSAAQQGAERRKAGGRARRCGAPLLSSGTVRRSLSPSPPTAVRDRQPLVRRHRGGRHCDLSRKREYVLCARTSHTLLIRRPPAAQDRPLPRPSCHVPLVRSLRHRVPQPASRTLRRLH